MPRWNMTINLRDVFHNDDLTLEQKRDIIVQRLRKSWVQQDGGPLDRTVEDLAEAVDEDEFDGVWEEIYGYADADRVWLATL